MSNVSFYNNDNTEDALDRMYNSIDFTNLIGRLSKSVTGSHQTTKDARLQYYQNKFQYLMPNTTKMDRNHNDICGSLPKYEEYFKLKSTERSRFNEDKIMYNTFFLNMDASFRGSYIELGAFNGLDESNTRFFDVCLGWDGLLIEGNPHEKVWGSLVKNRPQAHRMNYVPSCTVEEEAANKTVPFHSVKWTNAGIEDEDVTNAYKGRTNQVVDIPCGSMTQVILDLFPQGRVSFFSLDVEGSEHLVLRAIDFTRVFIDVLMVEVKNTFCDENSKGDCASRDMVREQLRDAGYVRFSGYVSASDVHVHSKSELLQEAYAAGWKETGFRDKVVESTKNSGIDPDRLDRYITMYKYEAPDISSSLSISNMTQKCGSLPEYEEYFKLKSTERSRFNEDKIMYNTFFLNMDASFRGSYIELGAFNGLDESNTRFFDVCLGWDGLLIEGNPHEKVWGSLVKNRPQAHRMNYVPSCTVEEEAANKTVPFHSVKWTNAGIEDEDVTNAYKGRTNQVVDIPCGSMTQVILDLFPQGRVSFFSLDVEGSEHLVLRAIDFTRVFIDVLMVEVKNTFCDENSKGDCASRDMVREQLRDAGYVRFSGYVSASDVHVHSKSELLQEAYAAGWEQSILQDN